MDPFRRVLSIFRGKPALIGTPPSARQISADPAAQAMDFAPSLL